MYSRQKGLLPTFTTFVGFFLIGYFFVGTLYMLTMYWANEATQQPIVNTLFVTLASILIFTVIFSPFTITGLFIAGMFPDIKLTNKGVKYRYLQLVSGVIRWEEIEEVIQVIRPRGCMAIVIARKGISLFNGLWFNSMYGIMNRHDQPLLLLSKSMENRDKLIAEIRKNSLHSSTQQPIAKA